MFNSPEEENAALKMEQINSTIVRRGDELIFSQIFHDTILDSEWLSNKSFSPGRFAVGYPFLYVMYRALNEFQPKSILELGVGQSTRMTAQYTSIFNCEHLCIDHNKEWLDFFSKSFALPDSTKLVHCDLIEKKSGDGKCAGYMDFETAVAGRKYDMVIIDGPYGRDYGTKSAVRIDTLSIMPEQLEKTFIILLDDFNRSGEKKTFSLMKTKLKESGIAFRTKSYSGMKDMALLCSSDLSFLTTL